MKTKNLIHNYKFLFIFFTILLTVTIVQAQSPLQFNFQAIARDVNGTPITEQDIKVRFTIRNETTLGLAEYVEIRQLRTNQFGMFSTSIGSNGAYFSTGSLEDVNWKSGKKFLQAEIDIKGGNNYIDLGATQLVSVPYALFAQHLLNDSQTNMTAKNGISIADSSVQLGNEEGADNARLMSNRILPLNGNSFGLKDGISQISFSKEKISIQQDSTDLRGGEFFRIDPIFPRADALPFVFTRTATEQFNGTVSPNEVVMWGHNLAGGGGALIHGLPAIGYSLESNYKPSAIDRFVESHEYYVTPQGQQIRLKSYTIRTDDNFVDFYHSIDNFYLKHPRTGEGYFTIANSFENNSAQQLTLGDLRIDVNNIESQIQLIGLKPHSRLFLDSWSYINLPGLNIEGNGLLRVTGQVIADKDAFSYLGHAGSRFANVSALNYQGAQMAIKKGWAINDDIQPTSALDITSDDGFDQLRLRKSFTPTGSSDSRGNTGDMAWDENYIYIKTASGWKRSTLSDF